MNNYNEEISWGGVFLHPLTRREFIALVGRGVIAAGLARWLPFLPEDTVSAQSDTLPLACVSTGTNMDSPETILRTALDGLGGISRFVKPGMTVAIKPNATWAYPPHTASSSDPDLLRAVIRAVREAGASRIIVTDHCALNPGTADCLLVTGIGQVVKEEGVEGVFPDRTNSPLNLYAKVDLPDGKAFQRLGVVKAALEADLRINLALAKTHNVTRMTLCLKHMMGFLQSPGLLHVNLDQGIADLSMPSSPFRADLHILEALRVRLPSGGVRVCAGPETDETDPQVVSRRNQVIAGTDPVLIDAYAALTYYETQPDELPYIKNAFESGIGALDVQAALGDGRLRIFTAGKPVESGYSTATVQPTAESAPATNVAPAAANAASIPVSTTTPLPTTIAEVNLVPAAPAAPAPQDYDQVVDPRPFLSIGLIPAAAAVAGAGLVAASGVLRHKPAKKEEKPGDEHPE
ncbi:MAG TPA: DUF362 domain-containing protein [Anaerolineaceae bacterium]|nr:DUF362 domain-containing protein [Anaerolineaceae bacterium]